MNVIGKDYKFRPSGNSNGKKVGIDNYLPFDERRKKKFVIGTRRKFTGKYKGEHPSQIL